VSDVNVLRVLTAEAALIGVIFAVFGAMSARKLSPAPAKLATTLLLVLVGYFCAGFALWAALGPHGGVSAVIKVRLVMTAEAITVFALAAWLARIVGNTGVAAVLASLMCAAAVLAPIPGETVAQGAGDEAPRRRTIAGAVSPAFAGALIHQIDVIRLREVYDRTPASQMEMHMTSWTWTFAGWFLVGFTGLALLFLTPMLVGAMRRLGRSRAAGVATMCALLLLVPAGCKKKDDDKKPKTTNVKKKPDAVKNKPDAVKNKPAAKAGTDTAAIKKASARAAEFLLAGMDDKGMIGKHPGVTGMALYAILSAPAGIKSDDKRIVKGLAALAALAKKDGAIFDKDSATYVTALAMLAFQKAGAHANLIKPAAKWLVKGQFKKADKNFGGMGYGKSGDADLSNLHFALEALKETAFKDDPEVYKRAIKFIERCQNRSESNDQKFAGDDGGFVYKPGASKAGGTKSSGSMTYAGVKSFLYANADKKDPRVVAAMDWLRGNFSVDENPGMGAKALYYYYQLMAKALALVGDAKFTDSNKVAHDWYAELSKKLLSLQKKDGSWKNDTPDFWEGNPYLATSRALLALGYGFPQ